MKAAQRPDILVPMTGQQAVTATHETMASPGVAPTGMVWVPDGILTTGSDAHYPEPTSPYCPPANPRVSDAAGSDDAAGDPDVPRRVIRGGSHLCAPLYCLRDPRRRSVAQAVDGTTLHLGFRCILHP